MGATRSSLRTRARLRADQDQSTFPTDTQYNLLINEAAKDVWFDLIQAGWTPEPEDYAVALTGAGSYALGTSRATASYAPSWVLTTSGGSVTGLAIQWIDDDGDTTLRNRYGLYYANHTAPPTVSITISDRADTSGYAGDVTISFATNVSPGVNLSAIKDALEATGRLTLAGTWPGPEGIARINQANIPAPGFIGYFSGGTAGSGQVFSVTGVFRQDGSVYTELPRIREEDRAAQMSYSGPPAAYDLLANQSMAKVAVYPPSATGALKVRLIREYPGLNSDYERWQGPVRSDELIALRAAVKGCRKEGNDQGAAQLEREYAFLLVKVQNMAGWLHGRHSATIRDVSDSWFRPVRDPFDYDI